jgi:anthranilate phosphoribosyltransferase
VSEGITMAAAAIDSGQARAALAGLVAVSREPA